VSLVPDQFPLPYAATAEITDVEDPWLVGDVPSPISSGGVEVPWWIEMLPGGGGVDLESAIRQVREAPVQRPIGFRNTAPQLLSDQRFLIGAVSAALAVSPGVIIKLTER
jgi:hypothetical protein